MSVPRPRDSMPCLSVGVCDDFSADESCGCDALTRCEHFCRGPTQRSPAGAPGGHTRRWLRRHNDQNRNSRTERIGDVVL